MTALHYVNVGSQGTFQKTGAVWSEPENVDAIIAHIEQNNLDHVGLYLHGGLVDETAGIDGAARFHDVFAGAGTHGVSLVWETGWLETIQKNLGAIFSTTLFQTIVEKVINNVLSKFT